jgi:sugar lactone lactonase YvrE
MLTDAFPQAETSILAESPIWDHEQDRLIWTDMMRGIVFVATRAGNVSDTRYGRYLGAVALASNGDRCLVFQNTVAWPREGQGAHSEMAIIDSELRFNDAGCDPAGRLLIGTTRIDGAAGGGGIGRVERDGSFRLLAEGLHLPNGIGWNAGGDRLYLADSGLNAILQADYNSQTGEMGSLERFVTVEVGKPDGLCLCEDGSLWVALWGAGCVRRYSQDGRVVDQIDLPVTQPSSCAVDLAGSLYITTAAYRLSSEKKITEPLAGRVLRCESAGPSGVTRTRLAL